MDLLQTSAPAPQLRFSCHACYKHFSNLELLERHLYIMGHSSHDPVCPVCNKHCRCLDAVREHLLGPLAKKECAARFQEAGCCICLSLFETANAARIHRLSCQVDPPFLDDKICEVAFQRFGSLVDMFENKSLVVSIDCEMVGGGRCGTVNLCARVCVVDEHENVLLNTFVRPKSEVTDYRFEFTGIKPEDLQNGMPLSFVKNKIQAILSGRRRLLVGHDLRHDLGCLSLDHPVHLLRDTACYQPLLRTNGQMNKLKYLTKTYLGYDIQEGKCHDPFEDAVAALRLYKRMRSLNHSCSAEADGGRPYYYCWCNDTSSL